MNIRDEIKALHKDITLCRRAMHENPQTAYEETFASDLVADSLTAWGIPFVRGLGKTGVVATIAGKTNTGNRAIGLRADMDALDILEDNNKPWVSKTPGKMHGCGHDGHTAMLLGAARYLKDTRHFDGLVHLIFQPAEEGARGAQAMIDDGLFTQFPCAQVFGLHNWPQLPRGTIALRPGPIMASSDTFTMKVLGKGAHAAMPHGAIDPVVIGSQIVMALQTLVSREVRPVDPAVISVPYFKAGTGAHNVIPDTAELKGTVRTYSETVRAQLERRIPELARGIAQSLRGDIEFSYKRIIDVTDNDPAAAAFCAGIARDILGAGNVNDNVDPSMGGEDFGAMMSPQRPGCYIWMGQGEPGTPDSPHNSGLHTPRYDFNDAIIPLGIEYWARIAERALPLK